MTSDVDPTFVNGGVIAQLGVSSGSGRDDLFVIEADESDGTFLLYDTSIALITNVDPDHLDHWGTRDAFYAAFARFANEAREVGRDLVRRCRRARCGCPAYPSSRRHVRRSGGCDRAGERYRTDGPVSPSASPTAGPPSTPGRRSPARTMRSTPQAAACRACSSHSATCSNRRCRCCRRLRGHRAALRLHGASNAASACLDDYAATCPTEVAAALRSRSPCRRRRAHHRDPAAARLLPHGGYVPASSPKMCSSAMPTTVFGGRTLTWNR